MRFIASYWKRFVRSDLGVSTIEYSVVLALIGITCINAVRYAGQTSNGIWSKVAENVKTSGAQGDGESAEANKEKPLANADQGPTEQLKSEDAESGGQELASASNESSQSSELGTSSSPGTSGNEESASVNTRSEGSDFGNSSGGNDSGYANYGSDVDSGESSAASEMSSSEDSSESSSNNKAAKKQKKSKTPKTSKNKK